MVGGFPARAKRSASAAPGTGHVLRPTLMAWIDGSSRKHEGVPGVPVRGSRLEFKVLHMVRITGAELDSISRIRTLSIPESGLDSCPRGSRTKKAPAGHRKVHSKQKPSYAGSRTGTSPAFGCHRVCGHGADEYRK